MRSFISFYNGDILRVAKKDGDMQDSNVPLLVRTQTPGLSLEYLLQILKRECNLQYTDLHPDFHWLNQDGSSVGIDQIRKLQSELAYHPYQAEKSVFIMTGIETASVAAQNALLKTLEEPPQHAQLLLTTANLSKVLGTIQSRCLILHEQPEVKENSIHNQDSAQLFDQIKNSSYAQLQDLTDSYADRSTAHQLVENLLLYTHRRLRQQPQPTLVKTANILIKTQQLLDQNVNVKLALDTCLFDIKRLKIHDLTS